ncbi:hypothetical protein PQX77_011246 [Marasmius sp. AFHP31]|nr:hypothetical protein PQX77_011246 [Marasmius sp. AFHP31]
MAPASLYRCSRCQLQVGGDVEDAVSEELAALWKSNVSPTSEKEPRAGYTATSYALEAIESQIQELSASLQSLEETRDRIAEKKRFYHSILHPIRRLPPEILAEIFRICTFGDTDLVYADFPGSLDTRKAPWTLSQVCRAWRSVAAFTPSLWTQVNIPRVAKISPNRATLLEALLSLQLERSGGQNLSLFYCSGSAPATSNERPQEVFLSMLCSRASQWRTTRLEIDVDSLYSLGGFHGAFCSLKRLEIGFVPDSWTSDAISACCAFEDCPSLTELGLHGKAQALQKGVRIPWKQITRYESREDNGWIPDLDAHIQTLSKLERVEVCILDSAWDDLSVPQPPLNLPLKLSFLHTLVVYDNAFCPGSASTLMKRLVLPALRVLRVSAEFGHPDTMLEFLDRSQCSLEELAFPVAQCDEGDDELRGSLTRFLKASALHNIRTFQIGWGMCSIDGYEPMREIILEALTLGREGKVQAMPKLRRLVMDNGRDASPNSTLLTMLSSRCFITSQASEDSCGGPRLEEFALWNLGDELEKYRTPPEQTYMDRLKEFSSSGLACKFYWGELDWYQID